MKLKSAVKVTDSKLYPHTYVAGSLRDVEHDAACAHALMQAMENFRSGAPYMDDDWLDALARRASQIMAEWGFDSGEVE